MKKTILYILVLQLVGILGFVWVGSLFPLAWLKVVVLILFAVGTVSAVFKSSSGYKVQNAIALSLVSGVCFVAVYQVIGFNFYPGLVKDVSLFSVRHLMLSGVVFGVMFVFYNLCCTSLMLKKYLGQ